MKPRLLPIGIGAAACILACIAGAAPRKHVIVDGNRTRPVHMIPLYDESGTEIWPQVAPAAPFSPRMTCGDCHDYDKIKMGWHFNSFSNATKPGRPGEPWVLLDESTGTQLPLSYRGWPGAWKPGDIGMTPWQFTKEFGRHMPGGDMGEIEEDPPDPKARWDLAGKLEINCLVCHNSSGEQNQSEWAIQVGRENFRWAATGASNLGVVENMVANLPDSYTLIDGANPDNVWATMPEVVYDKYKFNRKNFVFFDVTRNPESNRCYYCHSTIPDTINARTNWELDEDVHMAAGLKCTDCHRNNLGHMIVRGYEGERNDVQGATLTCAGCHLGSEGKQMQAMGGRLGAPRPLHRGLPPIHLKKLTCTACHSGPLPQMNVGHVRTARANRLGIHGRAQWDTKTPYILSPVYIAQADGKIAPNEMIWPAYWGKAKDNKVTPLPLDAVKPMVDGMREKELQTRLEAEAAKAAAEEAAKAAAEEAAKAAQGEQPAEQPAEVAAPAEGSGSAEQEAAPDAASAPGTPKVDVKACYAGTSAAEASKANEAAAGPEEEEAAVDEIVPLTEAQIIEVLGKLAAEGTIDGEPVYVSGGKVYRLASGGKGLTASEDPAAKPYAWPFAHDVRPASESLGAKGCTDCHSDDSGFFYAKVSADSPTGIGTPVTVAMYDLQKLDHGVLEALEAIAFLQPALIVCGVLLAVFLVAALGHFGMSGLESLLRMLTAAPKETNS